jgi:NADH:ubiquinone oxidoreductase subunit F (NADH-binding)
MARPIASHPLAPDPRDPNRLLAGWAATRRPARLAEHYERYGRLPLVLGAGRAERDSFIAALTWSGLRGRGGAAFPTGHKLRAVADRHRRPIVVANGCESEPASDKDHVLLEVAPHLVLDGAQLAAVAVGADEVILCVHRGDQVLDSVLSALESRGMGGPPVRITEVPGGYVASEESALVNFVNTGVARPTAKPPRPFERGVGKRPTLIDNVETLAQLALIARFGPDWFRTCGTAKDPGTALVTVSGAVRTSGVYEVPLGMPLGRILDEAGGAPVPVQAVLVGGYAGGWLPMPSATRLPLTSAALRSAGSALGVGSLMVLPADGCGLSDTEWILRYLADESANQCGPCMFGLPAVADDFGELVVGGRGAGGAAERLHRRLKIIAGRGACGHPDGAVRLAASALRVFEHDLRAHVSGHPCRRAGYPRLPQLHEHTLRGNWR